MSEPGFSNFQIPRFPDFDMFDLWKLILKKYGFERSKEIVNVFWIDLVQNGGSFPVH